MAKEQTPLLLWKEPTWTKEGMRLEREKDEKECLDIENFIQGDEPVCLINPTKKYRSLSSLNIQNIATEWCKYDENIGKELNEGVIADMSENAASATSDPTTRRDVTQRRALYCSLPFVCQFGMCQRENEVVDVLKSIQELKVRDEKPIMILDEVMVDKNNLTLPLFLATVIVMGAQFIVGYNLVVLNAPEKFIFPGHSTLQWAFVVSALAIGATFGAYSGGYIADMMGRRLVSSNTSDRRRRTSIILTNWIFLLSGLSILISPFIEFLMIGRFFLGFGCGISLVVGPIYLGEIAPPTVRGSLGIFIQFALVIGIFCATFFAYPFGSPSTWRFLFLMTPSIASLGLLLSSGLLESPKWLLLKNKSTTRVRHVIRLLRGYRSDDDVNIELASVLCACGLDSTKLHPQQTIWDLIYTTDRDMKKSMAMIILFQFCQQFSGINTVFYYSSLMLKDVVSSPMMGTIFLSFVNVLATYMALILIDHVKRKNLLLISDAGMLLSLVIVFITLSVQLIPNFIAFIGMITFVIFFELGLGPIPFLITAELFDVRSVASAMSVACICHWIFNFIVGVTFPFLFESLHSFCFLPYIFFLIVGFIIITILFEEKPSNLMELMKIFKATSQVHGK